MIGNLLPAPQAFGLPDKFGGWRPGQDRAVLAALDSPKRVVVQNAPTGFGKTVCYIAQALLSGRRTAILTATKGLQSQLIQDFAECGLVDIRGQGNYPCRALQLGGEFRGHGIALSENCDSGPCHAGAACSRRTGGCDYFDTVARAKAAQLVVTNYSYWIAQHRYSEPLGNFDLLVMDEAHDAPSELAASMEVEITDFDCETLLGRPSLRSEDALAWKLWAQQTIHLSTRRLEKMDSQIKFARDTSQDVDRSLVREAYALKSLLRRVQVIADMQGDWIVERRGNGTRIAFGPVWPAPYAERYLLLNNRHIVLVSATIKEKTLQLLGIPPTDYEFHEYPSTFPIERRPVIHVPSVRCKHSWSDAEKKTWVNRIDQLIDRRLDRKGIIHTASYERPNIILNYSRHAAIMLANDGTNTRTIVEQFRRKDPPCVLVSPSLTTGWDLPAEECEYAIIAKIPFPDTRSPITKARTEQDPDYGPYVAMQTIVQASGRGMRSAEDQCEVFIVDDQWVWFWKKFKKFAPRWFAAAVRAVVTVPDPLPKLTMKKGA